MSVSLIDGHIDDDVLEMTDNEIIKALECCCSPKVNACDDCPFYERCYNNNEWLEKEAIDLINRQKAEIERLQGLLSEWKKEAYKLADSKDEHFKICDEYAEKAKQRYSEMFDEAKGKIKVEAVKEFADMLIQKIVNTPTKFESSYYMYRQGIAYRQNEIIDLLKEMVGES